VKRPLRRVAARYLLAGIAVFFILSSVAPFVNASLFRDRIQRALEGSLGRKVEFSAVHFSLLRGPGFLLDRVTISEDPQYGIESFAYVPTLAVRLRLDKLFAGQIRPASLELTDPSVNLVKREDGTWNVVELVNRLASSRRGTLGLIPALAISDGRIDFKFGTRKSILYIADTDVSVYASRSGKVVVDFSGSPSRTDRAGNSFSHLHGNASWNKAANEVEAEAILDDSNLSEVTELLEGRDVGIHGTISSRARIHGPLSALRIEGEVSVEDVRRWDLLPASGERWRVRYQGDLDVFAHRLHVATKDDGGPLPVKLELRVNNLLGSPSWAMAAVLHNAPLAPMLPLAGRLGINVPQDLSARGMVDGAVGYSSDSALSGGIAIRDATAVLPGLAPLHAETVTATIYGDRVHFDPALVAEQDGGTLQAGGDYYFSGERAMALIKAETFPIQPLKRTLAAWFTDTGALTTVADGKASGDLTYQRYRLDPASDFTTGWSGKIALEDAVVNVPGIASPLAGFTGAVGFDPTSFELAKFNALLGDEPIRGSYRYKEQAKHRERIRIQIAKADLEQVEGWLAPALRDRGLLARLRFGKRSVPEWMLNRDLEGDAEVQRFSVHGFAVGKLSTRFVWRGTKIEIVSARIANGEMMANTSGSVDLADYSPRYSFDSEVKGLPWGGGQLSGTTSWTTSGTGTDAIERVRATGSAEAEDVRLAPYDFDTLSGEFSFSFDGDRPQLQLSNVQAMHDDDTWTGAGALDRDGKLVFDLDREGHPVHVISDVMPKPDVVSDGAQPANSMAAASVRVR
jgi:hypothetical protein